jgi:hypothetical protein
MIWLLLILHFYFHFFNKVFVVFLRADINERFYFVVVDVCGSVGLGSERFLRHRLPLLKCRPFRKKVISRLMRTLRLLTRSLHRILPPFYN